MRQDIFEYLVIFEKQARSAEYVEKACALLTCLGRELRPPHAFRLLTHKSNRRLCRTAISLQLELFEQYIPWDAETDTMEDKVNFMMLDLQLPENGD